MRKGGVKIAFALIVILGMSNCMTVKSYQKMHLNDDQMDLSPTKEQTFETNFQTYREGASGGSGGKVGGGCGCS